MEEQMLSDSLNEDDEIIFLPEEEISLSDMIVFENENSFDCESEFGEIDEVCFDEKPLQELLDAPAAANYKCLDTAPKQQNRRWKQKEVVIKTLESQFKVVMWAMESNDGETTSALKIGANSSPLSPKRESSALSSQSELVSSVSGGRKKRRNSPAQLTYGEGTCFVCKKSFKDYAHLRKHMHIHGPRTFICAECGKSFVEKSKLKRHQLVHTGEKPFKCEFEGCDKRFSLDFNLRTHVRTHTGVRPFVCRVEGCNKSFSQSTNLKSHMATHAGKIKKTTESDVNVNRRKEAHKKNA